MSALGRSVLGADCCPLMQIMPGQLEMNLAGILNSTEIAGIYGAITTAVTYQGTPAFDGIVSRHRLFRLGRVLNFVPSCTTDRFIRLCYEDPSHRRHLPCVSPRPLSSRRLSCSRLLLCSIIPIGLALILPDLYLVSFCRVLSCIRGAEAHLLLISQGDGQNAVEHEDLGGRPITEKPKAALSA